MAYRLMKRQTGEKTTFLMMDSSGSIDWEADNIEELGRSLKQELKLEPIETIGLSKDSFIITELVRKTKQSKGTWIPSLCSPASSEELTDLFRYMTYAI